MLTLGVIVGLFRFSRNHTSGRLLTVLFVYILCKEVYAAYLASRFNDNLSYYKYLGLLDACLIILIIGSIPIMSQYRKLLIVLGACIVLFYLVNLFYFQPPGKGVDTYFKIFRSVMFVLLSLITLVRINNTVDEKPLLNRYEFWISLGMLVFYSFNIFYWGLFNYFLQHKSDIHDQLLRPMFIIVNYFMYVAFIIAVLLSSQTSLRKQ